MNIRFPSFRIAFVILLFSFSCLSYGQSKDVNVSRGVFLADPAIENVYTFWVGYLNSHPETSYDNPFWNSTEKARYSRFDLLSSWSINPGIYNLKHEYKPSTQHLP